MKRILLSGVVAMFVLGAASVAHADAFTLTDGLGAKYALDYSSPSAGVYDIFLTIDTTGVKKTGPNSATTLGDVSIKVADDDANLKLILAPAGYTLQDGGLNSGGCDGSGAGFFCFNGSAAVGGIYYFEVSITDAPNLQTNGSKEPSIKDQFFSGTTRVEQLSDNTPIGRETNPGTFGAPPAAAPEPTSLMLLGTGALGLAGAVRRKYRRS